MIPVTNIYLIKIKVRDVPTISSQCYHLLSSKSTIGTHLHRQFIHNVNRCVTENVICCVIDRAIVFFFRGSFVLLCQYVLDLKRSSVSNQARVSLTGDVYVRVYSLALVTGDVYPHMYSLALVTGDVYLPVHVYSLALVTGDVYLHVYSLALVM